MKSLMKAVLLMIGMLTLLVACGGGGGGGGGGITAIAVTVTPVQNSVLSDGSLVNVTATFAPALANGTSVTFTIPTTDVATFADGTKQSSASVSANAATVQVKSSIAGTATITATCTGGSGTATITFTPLTLVSGVAAKGFISGATVEAFSIVNDAVTTTLLGTDTTASDGTFGIDVRNYTGSLMVKVTGGTYLDEGTGNPVNLSVQASSGLRAYVGTVTNRTPSTVAVTPLTELAVRNANAGGSLTQSAINSTNSTISTAFGIDNIITTMPASLSSLPTDSTNPSYTPAQQYARSLAAISLLSEEQSKTVEQLLSDYQNNVAGLVADSNRDNRPVTLLSIEDNTKNPMRILASTSPALNSNAKITVSVTNGFIGFASDTNEPSQTELFVPVYNNSQYSLVAPFNMKCTPGSNVTIKARYDKYAPLDHYVFGSSQNIFFFSNYLNGSYDTKIIKCP